MHFKGPTPKDKFFRTPAHDRPQLDLGVAISYLLPPHLREADNGATRWFDLVMGFGLDEAARRGINPRVVNNMLDAGNLVVQAFFFRQPNEDAPMSVEELVSQRANRAAWIGTVAAREDRLIVAGGEPASPPAAVYYKAMGGFYTALVTQVAGPTVGDTRTTKSTSLASPYQYQRPSGDDDPQHIPDEMLATYVLNEYAQDVEAGLLSGSVVVRATVDSIVPGDLPERE